MSDAAETGDCYADVLLVGGDISNCILAYWLAEERPDILIGIVAPGTEICSSEFHIFQESSLSRSGYRRLQPFISRRWREQDLITGQSTADGKTGQRLQDCLACISGEMLRQAIFENQRIEVLHRTTVVSTTRNAIELPGHDLITAPLVVESVPQGANQGARGGKVDIFDYRVFLAGPHRMDAPISMDVAHDQSQGFRWTQVLPLSEDEVLVRLHQVGTADENFDQIKKNAQETLETYVESFGWRFVHTQLINHTFRPFMSDLSTDLFWRMAARKTVANGANGGFFHHGLFDEVAPAVEVASLISDLEDLRTLSVKDQLRPLFESFCEQQKFFHTLNEMILAPGGGDVGAQIYRHLFGLSPAILQRFYAGKLWSRDKIRISMATPGAQLSKALEQMGGLKLLNRNRA